MSDEKKTQIEPEAAATVPEAGKPEAKPKGTVLSPSAGTTDNSLIKWFVGVFALIFFIALILWTASLTLGIMDIVLPHNPAAKYYALALFDGGALVWLGMFAYQARGVPQRGVSLLMFCLDFLGVILMTIGGVYMGGQALADIPAWLGSALVNGVIGATLANVGAAYYFHLNNPETRESMQAQSLEDTINEEAIRQARANVEREARQLGSIMARRATARIKYRLALPMSVNERSEWEGETIEATAEDVPTLPAPADDVPAWVRTVFRFFGEGRKQPRQSAESTSSTTSNDSN